MTEAETPPTTPQASAQAGRHTLDMARKNPITTRRSVLAATLLAALAVTMPGTTLGQVKADQEIIAICGEIIALESHINSAYPGGGLWLDQQLYRSNVRPLEEHQSSLVDRLDSMTALTLDGHKARAKAILACFPEDIRNPADTFAQMVSGLVCGLAGGAA